MTTFTGHLTDSQAQRLVDGALLDAERTLVLEHQAACAECQALAASYRALSDALDGLEVPELAPDFTETVMARIDHRERAAARERRVAAAIVVAGVFGLLAAVGLSVGQWGELVVQGLDLLASAGRAIRLSAEVATPVVSALRLHIGLACAVVAVPMLVALSRLMSTPTTETA
jgi:anti-sigma factor RsiW